MKGKTDRPVDESRRDRSVRLNRIENAFAKKTKPMPWDESYYPRSGRKLPSEVRLKAIEIANALLEESYDEGKAIRIAIAKAKEMGPRCIAG